MRHRGNSKIKLKHGLIPGVRGFLERVAKWDEIDAINPGVITPRKGSGKFSVRVQYHTESGVKCIARSGSAVQELFFVTSEPSVVEEKLQSLDDVM